MRRSLLVLSTLTIITFYQTTIATADPIPGRDVLKFSQRPMINTTIPGPDGPEIFHGHDELSTAWGVPVAPNNFPTHFQGAFMADDFADHFNSPVVHVKWWGSYLNRPTGTPEQPGVRQFLISFENDVPATAAGGFSHPGEDRFNQIVRLDPDGVLSKGEGTFTERLIPGSTSVDGPIYEYNAELFIDKPFREKADTVYWLKIVALDTIPSLTIPLDQRLQWGWHNRDYTVKNPLASTPPAVSPGEFQDGFLPVPGGEVPIYHFQDNAVSGIVGIDIVATMPNMPIVVQDNFQPEFYQAPSDGPSLIATHSKDLAFELYTIPEPGTIALVAIALFGCWTTARRKRA
jgi:hypothetical protein